MGKHRDRTAAVVWLASLMPPLCAYCQTVCHWLPEPTNSNGPDHAFMVSYLLPSRVGGYGHTDVIESKLRLSLFQMHAKAAMAVGMDLGAYLLWFAADAGIALPELLLQSALQGTCVFRDERGTEMRLQIAPGMYSELSDVDEKAFSLPMAVSVSRHLSPGLVGSAGFVMRPDFDREVLPVLSLDWSPGACVQIQLGVPATRVCIGIAPDVALRAGAEWVSDSYAIGETAYGNGTLTVEHIRTHLGLSHHLSGGTILVSDIGYAFARTLELDRPGRRADEHFVLGSAPFVRIGFHGTF